MKPLVPITDVFAISGLVVMVMCIVLARGFLRANGKVPLFHSVGLFMVAFAIIAAFRMVDWFVVGGRLTVPSWFTILTAFGTTSFLLYRGFWLLAEMTISRRIATVGRDAADAALQATNGLSIACIVADEHGAILSWNDTAAKLFGYEGVSVTMRPLSSMMPLRYRQRHEEALSRVGVGGRTRVAGQALSVHGLKQDGKEFPITISVAPWDSGSDTLYIGLITERQE